MLDQNPATTDTYRFLRRRWARCPTARQMTRWPEYVRMRLLTVHWLALLSILTLTVGCSSTDTDSTGDPTPRPVLKSTPLGFLIEPEPAAEVGYRLGWASPIKLLEGQEITSVTVLDDMVIVVEDPVNMITALSAKDGELLWKTTLGSRLETLFAPSRDGRELYFHSASRMFTLQARNGQVIAAAPLQTPVSAPAVYSELNRLMIMSGVDGMVFAHSVDNNFSRWSYRMANRISSSPVIAGQDVFVVDVGGTYAMLEASTGLPLWRNHTLGPVTTSPGVQDSEVIVASSDGKLYALNRTTGKDTWVYLGAEQPLTASPTVLGRLIILPLPPDKGLVALDAITGEELWRSDSKAKPVLTRQQDMLMYTPNSLVSIELSSGEVLAEVPTKTLMSVTPIGDDGSLLLTNASGKLLRISPSK